MCRFPDQKIVVLEDQTGDIVEERAARRREEMKRKAARHATEFATLQTAEGMVEWLRWELQAKRVSTGLLMPIMDWERTGKVRAQGFERGLCAVHVECVLLLGRTMHRSQLSW